MSDTAPKFALDDAEAWLENALLSAAAEISAFRASAQAERERSRRAQDVLQAQVRELESSQRELKTRHAAELAELRGLLDAHQSQRADAWSELSEHVAQRCTALTELARQRVHAGEQNSSLRRDLTAVREQLQEVTLQRDQLEARLRANEESFASAAQAVQQARQRTTDAQQAHDALRSDLAASTDHCLKLQAELQTSQALCASLESARSQSTTQIEQLRAQLTATQARGAGLDAKIALLEKVQSELTSLRSERQQLQTALEQAREAAAAANLDCAAARKAADQAEADLRAAQGRAELRQQDLVAARRDRDDASRTLAREHQEQIARLQTQREQLQRELDNQAARARSEREQLQAEHRAQTTQQQAESDRRGAELQAQLTALRAERARIQAELAGQGERAEGEHALAELQARLALIQSERDQLQGELAEVRNLRGSMLETEKQRTSKLKAEIDQMRTERDAATQACASLQAQLAAGPAPPPAPRKPEAPTGVRVDTLLRERDDDTMPLADLAPANDPPPDRRAREGTSYSINEVAEEQVFLPDRLPLKGGGGRGSR